MTLTHWLLLLAVLGMAGCAAGMTQAELEADTRDTLTVQQTHPKMFTRPDTTVGTMRADFRECATRPDGAYTAYRTYSGSILPGGSADLGAQAADYFNLGTVGAVATHDPVGRTFDCKRDKGYSQATR